MHEFERGAATKFLESGISGTAPIFRFFGRVT
jgi:hypothetical protein